MRRAVWIEALLVLLVFGLCLAGALLVPVDQCPDEAGRRLVSEWIAAHRSLPTGDEPGTMLMYWEDALAEPPTLIPGVEPQGWGFSYALRPYLSAMLAAAFQLLASHFTASPRLLLAASRLGSVLSVTLCCLFCLRLGRRLFTQRSSAVLFAAFVCLLPQVTFLGMYQNNDSLSLCAVSMLLCCWVEGYDRRWPVRSCLGLALALSLCLLSYYSAYGWVLTVPLFCVLAVLSAPDIPDKARLLLRRTALVLAVCLLLAGWFFLRNALLHGGDFLGLASEAASRARMEALGYHLYDYDSCRERGVSILEFLRMDGFWWLILTLSSFVGLFGCMAFRLPKYLYLLYAALMAGGGVLFALSWKKPTRRETLLLLMLLCGCVLTVLLHFWQSYARDYQPQGRYIITLALPLGLLLARAADRRLSPRLHPALAAAWLGLFAASCATMAKM